MDALYNKQKLAAEQLSRLKSVFDADPKSKKTVSYEKRWITKLETLLQDYLVVHKEILKKSSSGLSEAENPYFANQEFTSFELECMDFLAELEEGLGRLQPDYEKGVKDNASRIFESDVKLPRIELPKFDGNYDTWPSFKDLFLSLIHRKESISNVEKLHYLKCSLYGEAENLLRAFQITDGNYEIAWNILLDRYDNKNALLNNQFQKLFNLGDALETVNSIKHLLDKVTEFVKNVENFGVVNIWHSMVIFLATQRLPPTSREMWEQQQASHKDQSTLEELHTFLETRFRALEATAASSNCRTMESSRSKRLSDRNHIQRRINGFHAGTSRQSCVVCREEHHLMKCPRFVRADASERFNTVKRNNLCINCLGHGHMVANCRSTKKCLKCQKTHHTMLHREIKQNVNVPPVAQPSTSAQALSSLNALTTQRRSIDNRHFGEVLLATALIKVVSHNGTVQLRALLDQGSQASFITEDAVQKLGLLKKTLRANVFGIGQACSQTTSGIVKAKILLNNGEFYNMEALVLPKLTNLVPNRYIQVDQLNNFPNVTLADPHFNIPGKIDLLLGADTYAHLILADVISLEEGPLLQNTRLGWIISGSIGAAGYPLIQSFNIGLVENDDLGAQLKMFWELEEVTTKKQPKEDDIQAEEHYKNTVSRSNSGRYTVRLPFKNMKAKNELGRSRYSAVSSWKHMETRMEKNPSMKEEYVTCIQEYIDAGYLVPTEELVENSDSKQQGHYLAHHAVRKESTTTKTRIVFDASRKTNTGVSLNDVLLTGPVLQNDMLSVLIRFRTFKFAIVADIAKMFLQIKLHDDDTNYQRIVWRSSQQENIHDYRLTTVTFGLTCAPFLAIRTLHQLAIDEGANYPLAAESIKREFYVDDVLSGGHSIEEATQKRNELMNMLESGGFHLRKWMSNNRKLLDGIPTDDVESVDVLDLDLDIGYRSLGLLWHPTTDTFAYRIQTDNWKTEGECSKRSILSDIARLYDPFGWIAPVTVRAKILMQALWKLGLNWDDSIPEDTLAEWMDIKGNLKQLGSLRIRRWIDTYSDSTVEIHGFCDASLEAYAATIFIVTRRNNESKVHLVMAKTKVAPVQGETIPKLELCGALLLAKMIHQFKESFSTQLNITSTILWSDNETVLAWLRGHPSKWNIFVANRTAQIVENVGNTPWRYVPSADNPADLATRGLTTKQLMDSKLWWNGPSWLEHNEDQWPRSSRTPSTDLEKKRSTLKCFVSNLDTNFLASILSKFSSLTRLIRVTAFCIRFIRLASKQTDYKGYLTTSELHEARLIWIKFAQQIEFSPEIKSLQRNEDLPNTSKILCLNPIVKDGLLRATGRLDNSNLSDDEKHPLILPSKGTYTKLLLENIHKTTLHGGTQLMLATLRKYYWVLNGRNAVKAVIHGCIACFRNRPKLSSQLMGSLPSPRVNISRPFLHVGIDYCGPFNIKDRTGRGAKTHKGYVAVFVCLAVKAIHIELVNDMTTQAFLAAFKRFVGRRGLCSDIYSDCGSNFIGADAELRRITKANNSVAELLANDGVTWHFNPPASPHFGGLWEAGVKSVKQHLHRTLQDTSLSYEELCTTLIQIEACLNSRPLCPMYDDPTDTTALTPGHFLIGDTLLHAPETNLLDEKMNRLDRWQLTQRLSQQFWKRWSQEYLARLQQRPKWLVRRPNPEVGDLCLIKDDKFPPYRWPLAKIIELHPGKDMLVRVVTVATNGTTLKRNITKIALLPTQSPHFVQ